MKKTLFGIAGIMVLSGCASMKAYNQLQKDVKTIITKSMDEQKVDCPSTCEMLKNYIKTRYGIGK